MTVDNQTWHEKVSMNRIFLYLSLQRVDGSNYLPHKQSRSSAVLRTFPCTTTMGAK